MNTELKAYILDKKSILKNTEVQLKKEFIGLDHIIDEIIDSITPWFLFPEVQLRPLVINLWGMTGTGKTALVKRFSELLSYDKAFLHIDSGEFGSNSDIWLKSMLSDDLVHYHEKEVIICLDEFQFARTIDENGNEIEKDKLRIVWELIDSGKFYYNASPNQYTIKKLAKLLDLMSECLNKEIEISEGKIVENFPQFSEMFKGFSLYYYADNNKKQKKNYFISNEFISTIYELVEEEYTTRLQLIDKIKTFSFQELYQFVHESMTHEGALKLMDLSKSLIFIIGNLDEAYYMSSVINPDISANDFHKETLKITISDVKTALQNRFRNEQVARLGNSHIVYPSFDEKNYIKFIEMKLNLVKDFIKDKFGYIIEFHQSVTDIVYKEGVFPTQGVRPVLTTIGNLIESYASKLLTDLIEEELTPQKIEWKYEDEKYVIKVYVKNKLVFEKKYLVNLKVNSLRKSKNDDTQSHIAVHEAGHAIIAALATHILPELIVTQTVDNGSAGFCQIRRPEGLFTKKLTRQEIMIALGGFLAEKMIFGEDQTSTGVSEDIVRASSLANEAIKNYGMGYEPIKISVKDADYNDQFFYSDEHGQQAFYFFKEAEREAIKILENNQLLLLKMAEYLTINSRMDRKTIEKFCKKYSQELWVQKEGFIEPDQYYSFKQTIQDKIARLEE